MVGAYAINNFAFDLWMALAIGTLGLLFRLYGYPITPLIIGVILGPMAELYFRRAVQISYGDYSILVSTPFTWAAYALLAVIVVAPIAYRAWKKQNTKQVG
jgi:putative tricarboxylic transport membrane protein